MERQRVPGSAPAPLLPAVTEGAVKEEEEEKNKREESGASSSPPTSVAGKMFSSMKGFFNIRSEDPATTLPETVPEDSKIPGVDEDESEMKVHGVAATADEPGDIIGEGSRSLPSGAEGEDAKDETTLPEHQLPPFEVTAAAVVAGAAVVRDGDGVGSGDGPRTYGPEEKQAYSDNVDHTLEVGNF